MDMLVYLNSNDMKEKGIFREPTEKPLNNTQKNKEEDMTTEPSEYLNLHCSEEVSNNILEDFETDKGSLDCLLCDVAILPAPFLTLHAMMR